MTAEEIAAVERAVEGRFSCRGYLPTPVPRPTIAHILRVAQGSASWCNSQAWHLTITEGEATERFRQALFAYATKEMAGGQLPAISSDIPMPERYAGVYNERRRACGLALYESMGIAREDRAASANAMLRNFELFGAPHVMIVTTPRDLGAYGAVDCGSFIGTFLTVAHAHGVATIAQGAIAVYAAFVRDWFRIPEDRLLLCGVSFGYADPEHPANGFRTARADPVEVVNWAE